MKRLPGTLAGAGLLLILAGVTSIWVLRTRDSRGGSAAIPLPAPPPAVATFPDIAHVPIYPQATVTFTKTEGLRSNSLTYRVADRADTMSAFYQQILPQQGWQLRDDRPPYAWYSWTDPNGQLRWQLQLVVVIDATVGGSETIVGLDYGRVPNPAAGLPLYPDAQQTDVTHATIQKQSAGGTKPAQVTEISYLSNASSQAIAAFYATALPEDGWVPHAPGWSTRASGSYPFDNPGSWAGMSPQEGLYCGAYRPKWGSPTTIVTYYLLATATPEHDGRIRITLHIEEIESSPRL
jgi:hypothetical protein